MVFDKNKAQAYLKQQQPQNTSASAAPTPAGFDANKARAALGISAPFDATKARQALLKSQIPANPWKDKAQELYSSLSKMETYDEERLPLVDQLLEEYRGNDDYHTPAGSDLYTKLQQYKSGYQKSLQEIQNLNDRRKREAVGGVTFGDEAPTEDYSAIYDSAKTKYNDLNSRYRQLNDLINAAGETPTFDADGNAHYSPQVQKLYDERNELVKQLNEAQRSRDLAGLQVNKAAQTSRSWDYYNLKNEDWFQSAAEKNNKDNRITAFETAYTPDAAEEYARGHRVSVPGSILSEGIRKHWDLLTDAEKQTYNAILNHSGQEEADAFLDDLQVWLDKRKSESNAERIADVYKNAGAGGKLLLNAASLPNQQFGAIPAAVGSAASMTDAAITKGQFNPYNNLGAALQLSGDIRSAASEDIDSAIESDFLSKIAVNSYQAVMSGLDSALGAATLGKTGYGISMGAGAAAQKAKELYDSGASTEQIALGAIGSGLLEGLFEEVSLDKFAGNFLETPLSGVKDFLKKTAVQAGIEASEELNTEIANMILDAANRGYASDNSRRIEELMEQGMSRTDATNKARAEAAMDVFWAAYGGAISGGAMGGAGAVINKVAVDKQYKQTYGDSAAELVQEGLESPEGTESRKLAEAAKDKLDTGKQLSGAEIFKLVQANEQQIQTEEKAAPAEAQADTEETSAARKNIQEQAPDGIDGKVMAAAYIPGQNVERFMSAYPLAYYEGYNGSTQSQTGNALTPEQYQTAYAAGKASAANAAAEMYRTAGRNNIGISHIPAAYARALTAEERQQYYKEGYDSEEGIRLRQSSQRLDGANPGGQVQAMEGGAGEAAAVYGEAGSSAAEVSEEITPRQMGIPGGSETQIVRRIAPESYSQSERDAAAFAEKNGLKFVAFRGDSLEIATTDKLTGEPTTFRARAFISNGTMWVQGDHPYFPADQLARHEAAHEDIARHRADPDRVWGSMRSRFGAEAVRAMKELYKDAYAGADMTDAEIAEELFCDAQAGMNIFYGMEPAGFADVMQAAMREETETTRQSGVDSSERRTDQKFSREIDTAQRTITREYQKTVHDILNGKSTVKDSVLMGYTPRLFRELGMPSIPFTIGAGHIYSTAKTKQEAIAENKPTKGINFHGMGERVVANLYQSIQNPIMIIAAKDVDKKTTPMRSTHSVVAIVDVGRQGEHLLMPVAITAERRIDGLLYDVNALSSAYWGNVTNLVKEAIAQYNAGERSIYYANKNAAKLIDAGVQFPKHVQLQAALNGIVHRFDEKVNMGIADVTQSRQFLRWFGDWLNKPNSASKVVNSDGSPKIMYHGSRLENGDFNIFDYSKSKRKSGLGLKALGKGNYFTSNSDVSAFSKGGKEFQVYLDIKNPVVVSSGMDFRNAVSAAVGDNVSELSYDEIQNIMRESGYDGVIQVGKDGGINIAVTFDPGQIKSATDNVGTFDANNPDIRFSREAPALEQVRKQNEQLQKQLEYYRNQFKTTDKVTPREEDVRRIARSITKDYNNKAAFDAVLPQIQELAQLVLEDRDKQLYNLKRFEQQNLIRSDALEIAQQIVSGASVDVNAEQAETYRELKRFLRSNPVAVSQISRDEIGDYDDWRKRNRYTLRISDNGTPVDILWVSLQNQFGKGLFPDSVANQTDQLMHIVDKVDSLAPSYANPYKGSTDVMAQQVANDLLERLAGEGLRKAPSTFADRKQAQINRLQMEVQAGIAENRQRIQRDAQRREATETRRKIANLLPKFQKMATSGGRADSLHAPVKLVRSIIEFCEIFNESEELRLAKEMADVRSQFNAIGGIEATQAYDRARLNEREASISRQRGRLLEMKAAYEANKESGQFAIYHDENIDRMIQTCADLLDGKTVYDLTNNELLEVYNTMKGLHYTITNANQLRTAGHDKTLVGVANQWGSAIRDTYASRSEAEVKARRFLMWQMSPSVFLNYTCGFAKDNAGQIVDGMFVNGTKKQIAIKAEYQTFFADLMRSEDKAVQRELSDLMNKPRKNMIDTGLVFQDGSKVELPRGMAMELWMLLRQKDSFRSAQYGGFRIPNIDRYYRGDVGGAYGDADTATVVTAAGGKSYNELIHQINVLRDQIDGEQDTEIVKRTRDDIYSLQQQANELIEDNGTRLLKAMDKLWAEFTPLERTIIEKTSAWYKRSGQLMAETYEEMYGFQPKLVDDYVPIHRDKTSIQQDIRVDKETGQFNLENSSFTIERTPSTAPILLTDIFEESRRQSGQLANYCAFAPVQRDFNRLWNVKTVSNDNSIHGLISDKFGSGKTGFGASGEKIIQNFLADVSGVSRGEAGMFNRILGNTAGATLMLNARVAVSQAASIPTAAAVVGWKNMATGFVRGIPTAISSKGRSELAEKSMYFRQRALGTGSITELSEMKQQPGMFGKIANSKVGKVLFGWCQAMDVFSTATMWAMAEEQVQESGLKPGTDGFDAKVEEVYTEIIRKTQPNYTTTERSEFLRDQRNGMKLLNMYKTQSNQNLNILIESAGELRKMSSDLKRGKNNVTQADVKAAQVKLANSATSVLIGGTLGFVLLRTIMNAILGKVDPYRDDDTGEVTAAGVARGMAKDAASSLAGMTALGGELFDFVSSVVAGERYYGISDTGVSAVSDLLEQAATFAQDKEKTFDDWWKLAIKMSVPMGIPLNNATGYYKAAKMWYTDLHNGTLGQFTTGDPSKTQLYERLILAAEQDDQEKAAASLAYLMQLADGETDEEIQSEVLSGVKTYYHKQYLSGNVDWEPVSSVLGGQFDIPSEDLEDLKYYWDFQRRYPDLGTGKHAISSAAIVKYRLLEEAGMNAADYYRFYREAGKIESDKDTDGKAVSGSKKAKLVKFIVNLRLPGKQAKLLWQALKDKSWKDTGTPWE